MNEEDSIRELFQKAEVNYPVESLEEGVLLKIKRHNTYKSKKNRYTLIGKIGFGCFISLCVLFVLIIGDADTVYLMIGIPFILILLMIQLEIIINKRITQYTVSK